MEFVLFFLGIPTGILASMIAWWILFRGITPKMGFSSTIAKSHAPYNMSGFVYGFKVENSGSRTIVDAEFFLQLRIRGLFPDAKNNWKVIFLPLTYHRIPRMRPARDYGVRDIIRLCIEQAKELESTLFPEHIREKHKLGSVTLEDLMELGDDSTLQVISFGYDEFSGSRKVFESQLYRKEHIIIGAFEKTSLDLIPNTKFKNKVTENG